MYDVVWLCVCVLWYDVVWLCVCVLCEGSGSSCWGQLGGLCLTAAAVPVVSELGMTSPPRPAQSSKHSSPPPRTRSDLKHHLGPALANTTQLQCHL